MRFYNLKTRSHVEVPEKDVRKAKSVRKTKNGEQTRYMLKATVNGDKLFKFISEADYKSLNVPEDKGD